MADVSEYRFLPWARQGLAAELPDPDTFGPLPVRALLDVGLTVGGAGSTGVDLSLFGPGDAIGLDTRAIVRTEPARNTTDAETNYFAAIDFDPPDLPWMLTPAAPGTNQRLRPWLVLVCVDRSVVDPPAMTPGAPLPSITIPGASVAAELPDLAESWAWAHTQVTKGEDDGPVTGSELNASPILNVSRLMCPRWLEPSKSWIAALVPAFDAGVFRGLTGQQPSSATTGPAWDIGIANDVTLPVYYHWEFSTGQGGDFESLARKLRPFECPETVGGRPLYIGDAGTGVGANDPNGAGTVVEMEGALRSIRRDPGRLSDLATGVEATLTRAVNAPADHADGGADDETPAIGPPIYGSRQRNEFRITGASSRWLRELNVDPRNRVAASLGTDLVQAHQEQFVHEAWDQVEQVIDANRRLAQAALARETLRRLHRRHLEPLPPNRLAQVLAPVATRVLARPATTVRAATLATSVPTATTSGPMRRLTAGHRRLLRRAAVRSGRGLTKGRAAPTVLVAALVEGRADVDPTARPVTGLGASNPLAGVKIGRGDEVDLSSTGLPLVTTSASVKKGLALFDGPIAAAPLKGLGLRPDLASVGVISEAHVESILGSSTLGLDDLHEALDEVVKISKQNGDAIGAVLSLKGDVLSADALSVRAGDMIVAIDARGVEREVAQLEQAVTGVAAADIARAVIGRSGDIEADAIAAATATGRPAIALRPTDGASIPTIVLGDTAAASRVPAPGATVGGGPVIGPPVQPGGRTPTGPGGGRDPIIVLPDGPLGSIATVPPLIAEGEAIGRFEEAAASLTPHLRQTLDLPDAPIVALDAPSVMTTTLAAINPQTTVPSRLDSIIRLADTPVSAVGAFTTSFNGLAVAETHDRIFAGPTIDTPLYRLLADRHPNRFLPGVEGIPPNAITIVETNPAFVESFLVGVNHEFSRELLWREYPSEPRATVFHRFWQWLDGGDDIENIHTWNRRTMVGSNTRGEGSGGQIVLLVRGDLLRRYPNTVIYAWKGETSGGETGLIENPAADDIRRPVFSGRFRPDFTFVGFDLDDDDLEADPWFFVLQEQPTEPRFGFDDPGGDLPKDPASVTSANDLTWQHTGTSRGGHLDLSRTLGSIAIGGVEPARNGAHLAAATVQRPVRVALLSSDAIGTEDDPPPSVRFAGRFAGHVHREITAARIADSQ